MAVLLPPRPGRPKRDAVDIVRTRIWFQAVKWHSRLPSAHAIEAFIDGPRSAQGADGISRPRKWYAYEAGRRSPSSVKGKRDAVADAEAHFPGTERWYHHAIWKALRGESFDFYELEGAFRSLDPAVVDILYTVDDGDGSGRLGQKFFVQEDVQALVGLGSFDALAAVILLAVQSEMNGLPELREWVLEAYGELQPIVADLPELVNDFAALFDLTDKVCRHWVYVAPNQRLFMHVFWRERHWYKDRQKERAAQGQLADPIPLDAKS